MMNKVFLQIISRQQIATIKKLCAPSPALCFQHRCIESAAVPGGKSSSAGGKKTVEQKITLIGKNNEFLITTLQEAQKISKRRDLKLIKVSNLDSKTQRPLYKLSEIADALIETDKLKAEKKKLSIRGEKMLSINSTISENDLSSRIKNLGKWLTKNYEVSCIVTCVGNDHTKGDSIVKRLEDDMSVLGKIVQKRTAAGNIRFRITPKALNHGESSDEPSKS